MKHFIKEFKEISKNDAASAGGKGASLGEMTQAGIPVPPGFVILADAFESFLHQAEIHTEIDAILHKVDHQAMHTVEQASEEIKAIILSAQMPKEIAQEILTAFKKLDARFVAVRSSATAEDSSTAAWAGQLESYLNTTKDQLLENVKKCWASLFTPRAIFYRFEQNMHQQHISVAVVVQKMVESEVSGIAFSVHPVTQDYNQLIIEAGLGLGEAIVSGQITPDSYVLEKKGWEIIDKNIAAQTKALYRSKNGGNQWKEISASEQKLSDVQIIELSKLVVKIESHYGFPVDVEWALEKKKFYIVQSRPITTLMKEENKELPETKTSNKQYVLWATRFYSTMFNQGFCEYSIENGAKEIYVVPVGEDKADYIVLHPEFDEACHNIGIGFMKNANKLLDEYEKRKSVLIKLSQKLSDSVGKISDSELKIIYGKCWKAIDDFKPYMMFPHYMERELEPLISRKFSKYFNLICSIPKPVEYMKMQKMLFEKSAKEVSSEYGWLSVYGMTEKPFDENYFIEYKKGINKTEILKQFSEIEKNKVKFAKFLKTLNRDDAKLCKIAHEFVYERTDRIDQAKKQAYLLYPFVRYVVKKVSDKLDIREGGMLTREEIYALLEGKKPISEQELLERGQRKNLILMYNQQGPHFIRDDKLKEHLINECKKSSKSEEIRGVIAFRGNVKGMVKTHINKGDIKDSDQDYIMVCKHTSPQDLPYMKKAKAIVTDEGGITCHAAIVSRELGIPCLVGTRNATQILKDGDLVEVDADKGIVTIINKTFPSQYHKLMNRSFPLIFFEGWYKGERFGLPNISDDSLFFDPLFIYRKNKGTDVLYNFTDQEQNPDLLVEYFTKHTHHLKSLTEKHLKNYQQLIQLSKKDFSMKRLKEIFSLTLEMHPVLTAMVVIGNHSEERAEIVKISNQTRTSTEDFVFKSIDLLLKNAAKLLPPEYQEFLYFLTYTETIGKLPSIQTLRQRKEGYIYYQGKVHTAITKEEFGKENNLEIVEIKVKSSNEPEIKGNSAYRGKVIGKVRVVFEIKDMKKIERGEILVTSMTTPDLIAVSREFSAIVTDEGGMLCHAAIISREFKKPCIIGTKIATQVLKDGDLVEVDADKGVVRIIKPMQKEAKESSNDTKWYHLGKWVEPALAAEAWLTYGKYAQQFFKQKLDGKILYLNGNFFLSQHDIEIIKQESYEAAKSHDKEFFDRLRKAILATADKIIKLSKKIASPIDFLNSYQELTGVWMPLNIVSIGVETYVNEIDSRAFEVACGNTLEKPWTLQQIDEMRALKKEFKTMPQRLEDLPKQIQLKINEHLSKYEWKGSHHFSIHPFTFDDLKKQMNEDSNEKSKKENKSSIESYLVELLDLMGFIRFRCAEASGISTYYLSQSLTELAKQYKISYDEIVEHTLEELETKKINKSIAEKRKKNIGFLFDNKIYILTDEEIEQYEDILLQNKNLSLKEIRGRVACKGKAKGLVKLVRSKKEINGFEKGMILVAYETTPDVIVTMKKAAAIVTDFGGLTSHAAIISREFNIPCIIGTKIATQVLKDGDLVEVDADKGVVRKLDLPFKPGDNLFQEIKSYLKEHLLDTQNAKASILAADLVYPAYAEAKTIPNINHKLQMAYLKDDQFYQITPLDCFKNLNQIIYNLHLKDKIFLKHFIQKSRQSVQNVDDYWKKCCRGKKPTLQNFTQLVYLIRDWWEYAIISEDKGVILQEKVVQKIVENHHLSSREAFEIIGVLTHPEQRSILIQERLDFFSLCLLVKTNDSLSTINHHPKLKEKFEKYILNYFFNNTTFLDYKEITVSTLLADLQTEKKEHSPQDLKQFITEILTELKSIPQKKKALRSKIKFSKEEEDLIHFLQEFVTFTDERKSTMMKLIYYFFSLIHDLSNLLKISFSDLSTFTCAEIEEILNGAPLDRLEIDRRRSGVFLIYRPDQKIKIFYGQEALDLFASSKKENNQTELVGSVASRGKDNLKIIRGKVQIVIDPAQSLFETGSILVTSMTRIEFVPLMKKALAIITDEGGIACHAAIVSRELGIPCLIGTKIATQVLKDGDLVEVDADKGMVRIIQSKKMTTSEQSKKEISKSEPKDYVPTSFGNWKLGITRNMSFWHMGQSSRGHFHHSKDFNINYCLQPLSITTKGTHSSIFYQPEQVAEYSKAILQSLNTLEGIKNLKSRYQIFSSELLSSLDKMNQELNLKNWDDFITKHTRLCAGLFLTSTIGRAGLTKLTELLKKEGVPDNNIPEIIALITYPDEHTPLFKSQLGLLEIGVKVQTGIPPKDKLSLLQKWLNDHGFIPVNFCEDPWTLNDAETQLQELMQKNCAQELKRFNQAHKNKVEQKNKKLKEIGNEEISILAQAIAEGTYLNEFRKNTFSKVSLGYRDVFSKIAKLGKSDNWRDCFYLIPDEMRSLLEGTKFEIKNIIRKREIVGQYIDETGITRFVEGEDLKKFVAFIENAYGKSSTPRTTFEGTVKGFIANKGIVTGIVRIILSSKDFHKLNRGDILITTMTSVDFVPVMEKAGAFVTNEGGITSHASIVAREMNKPCIIGTQNATQVFRDGDLVEVDANQGIVRKLSNTQTSNTANSLTVSVEIAKIDWTKYLEREQPLFLFASFIRPYGELLQQATGIGFVHQLHTFQDKSGVFYKSKQEMAEVDAYFLGLIRRNDPRLAGWAKNAKAAGSLANRLIVKFTKNPRIDGSTFWNDYQNYEKVLLYDTVIPYRVLSAINSALEAGEDFKIFKQALTLFEPFRKSSRYPELVQKVCTQFWHAAARAIDEKDSVLLSLATPEELRAIFEDGIKLDRNELRQRKQWCAFWIDPKTKIIQFSYDQTLTSKIPALGKVTVDIRELKGNVAYPGLVRGTVRIINDLAQSNKVRDGDIIVSINTNPSLMPVILKCAGIVTDEGGIMCHAAIVARELKKPCIIGTKIATQVLKDGDLVEVNATEGIVKIVKKNK